MHNHMIISDLTASSTYLPQPMRKSLVINEDDEDIYRYRVSPKGALTLLLLTTYIAHHNLN
ncbi:hypothetical protein UFOVP477_23 [uncultured Caudovirales phage]|jgi:hypothetical protein|uniref:Uncharacterized protein n=1 Tax=uncultured Caudovirales phage TaxID=2100421 RepID=A0A6J5NWR9_9CAUD|nr:hypothetical protein UFOVP477_23 [uncultured Caudovirales phage]CAB4163467.1 hypothetical protein UFOVP798_27 [uncultured Caudovirales phage]CAB4191120.1 hypothetical protein UFOVP1222_6 [uncultured Caudovirales phage]